MLQLKEAYMSILATQKSRATQFSKHLDRSWLRVTLKLGKELRQAALLIDLIQLVYGVCRYIKSMHDKDTPALLISPSRYHINQTIAPDTVVICSRESHPSEYQISSAP